MRITFSGDILCYQSQDRLCLRKDGTRDYKPIFEQVKQVFDKSDYVVGSLETTFAGKELVYTHEDVSFNSPDELLDALKWTGFDMLTTANNHCLDRGESGLRRTLDRIDAVGLEHTGTRRTIQDSQYLLKDFGEVKIAFVSYTYGTNSAWNHNMIPVGKEYLVNLTRKQDAPVVINRPWYKRVILSLIPKSILALRASKSQVVEDCVSDIEVHNGRNDEYESAMVDVVRDAKSKADLVFFCLHSGGQFNSHVGIYTQHLFDIIADAGADVIVTNHAHSILPLYKKNDCWIASALGNFSFAPGEGYYVDGVMADYSIILHLDICNKKINNISFSICKSVINSKGLAITKPIYDIKQEEEIKKDINTILEKINCDTDSNNSASQKIYNIQI